MVVPAASEDRGYMGEVTPTKSLSGKYPQILLRYPHKQGGQFFTYRRPPRCRADRYCDALEFDIKKPDDYAQLAYVEIQVTWTAPNNDLDIYTWPDDDPVFGGPVAQGANRDTSGTEIIKIEAESEHIWLTVVNYDGTNAGGYEVRVSWQLDSLPPLDIDKRPGGRGSFGSSSASSGRSPRAFGDFGEFQEGAEPQVTTTPVMVPGPDGELIEMDLPVYVESEQANQSGPNLLVPAAIIAGILGILAAAFFYRRSRRQRIEEALSP
ncbi:MAG: hypothetical protein KY429_02005 [Actinobacteria bacterium]|nr:hypothetical protein [Actinomycetota bacterium]